MNIISDFATPFWIVTGFFGTMIALAVLRVIMHILGVYAIVRERQAIVYVLFGNVVGVLSEPGIHFLWK